jgi:selenide,water dikinase
MKRLVLIGGGHSHIEVLRRLALRPETAAETVLISTHSTTVYSGMLPGAISGHYRLDECRVDLARLARRAGAHFIEARVNGLHLDAKLAFCADGRSLAYDVASIDIGSRPATLGVPGASHNALAIKPIETFMQRWEDIVAHARDLPIGYRLLVVGAGAAGVEVLLAMQHRLIRAGARDPRFGLATDSAQILPAHAPRAQRIFTRLLRERQVDTYCGERVVRVMPRAVLLADGKEIPADLIVWAAGAAAPLWPGACGLATTAHGFVLVNSYLQSVNRPEIFAAGDVAELRGNPHPKAGVYAVRQGPALAANLRRALNGAPLVVFHPQRRALALISTGDRHAVASRGCLAVEGAALWRCKDWIDRRFVGRYA